MNQEKTDFWIGFICALGILACTVYYFYNKWTETIGGPNIIIHALDRDWKSASFHVAARVPVTCKIDEFDYQVRPWIMANNKHPDEGTWGSAAPQIGNGLATDSGVVDAYQRIYFVEMIRPEKYELDLRKIARKFNEISIWNGSTLKMRNLNNFKALQPLSA
jgi:hypothetical protein